MNKTRILLLSAMAAAAGLSAAAAGIAPVGVDSISYDRHGDFMVLDMNLDLTPTKVGAARAQVLTPIIISEAGDSLPLHSVSVYGRGRYINYLRTGEHPLGGPGEQLVRASQRPADLEYRQTVDWRPWMDNSEVVVRRRLYGCADCLLEERTDPLTDYFRINPAIPEIVYFPAPAEGPKTDTLQGSAFIDFVVDKVNIRRDYRDNDRELRKIEASVDTVIHDPDVTITGIWLKGFASPESPYRHNRDLAIGRTASLKNHVMQLYKLPEGLIATEFEPEDWEGLRRMVENSNIDNRAGILALIDSDLAPDAKEARIKSKYPKEYRFMLQNFYPALRHTDYRITYEIHRFDDVAKIRQLMHTRPSRLSLREFFLLGNAETPGTDEFNDVFETAVRLFPENEIANINAANAALQRADYTTAERYLDRAGNSPEAVYARGSLAFLRGDYNAAERLMKEALPSIPQAQSTLNEIKRIRAHSNQKSTSLKLD